LGEISEMAANVKELSAVWVFEKLQFSLVLLANIDN